MAVNHDPNFDRLDPRQLMQEIYNRFIRELPQNPIPADLPANFRYSMQQILQYYSISALIPITLAAARAFILKVNPEKRKASESGRIYLKNILDMHTHTGFSADGSQL